MSVDYNEAWTRRLKTDSFLNRPLLKTSNHNIWLDFFEQRRHEVLSLLLDDLVFPEARILDIGCGLSIIAQIVEELDIQVSLTGTDISELILEKSRARWPEYQWTIDDAITPHMQGKFDLVHAGEVIEHLPNDVREDALDRWCDYVDQGGIIIITTPSPTLKIPTHVHLGFIGPSSVREVFSRHEIRLVRVHGIGLFVPLLAKWILRFPDVHLRNNIYSRLLKFTFSRPLLADQMIYIGVRRRSTR